MNEPFVRKIYESGSDSVGSGIQDGLKYKALNNKGSVATFYKVWDNSTLFCGI